MTTLQKIETKEFLVATKIARESFVHKVKQQKWNTEMRTTAESLLNMYDQLQDKLEEAAK